MPSRVMIADDHQMFRDGVREMLPRERFQVIAEVADGREAIRQAGRIRPDLVILDIGMPGLNGIDATREILRASPDSRIVVLTMHQESPYLVEAMRAGARGYVLKNQPGTDLLHALDEVVRGDVYVPAAYWRALVEAQQNGGEPVLDLLTPREREVLQLVAEGKTTKEIASDLGISFKTAESHRTRLMAKLDIHETASLVRFAIRNRIVQA